MNAALSSAKTSGASHREQLERHPAATLRADALGAGDVGVRPVAGRESFEVELADPAVAPDLLIGGGQAAVANRSAAASRSSDQADQIGPRQHAPRRG